MRILHVVRGLANSSGTTHIVGPLAEAQARLGHQVSVYFVSKRREAAVVPDADLVESIEFPMSIPTRHYGWSRSFARHLKRTVRDFDIVHIHAIWNFPTWWTMRSAHKHGVPYIVAPQGSLETWALSRKRYFKGLYANTFERPLFNTASGFQALTQNEVRQCRAFGITAPVSILPNGVDSNMLESPQAPVELRKALNLSDTEKIVVFLGRLFPKKGLDLLAQAFGRIVKKRADVTLLIAGHDANTGYKASVEQMLVAAGASEKAIFLGEVRGIRKFAVLTACDIFVLPSYSEGLPVAVLEAMGSGIPVVITPGCNLEEVEQFECGWVGPPTVDALYKNLSSALDNPREARRRGDNGRALVRDRFTWSKIADASIEIYRECIGDSSCCEPGQGGAEVASDSHAIA